MNSVANALSRKEETKLMYIQTLHPELQRDINELEIELIVGSLANLIIQSTIFDGMKGAQAFNPELVHIMEKIREGKKTTFTLLEDEILHLQGRLCVPNDVDIRKQILSEAHETPYSVHPGATKMYLGLREYFCGLD